MTGGDFTEKTLKYCSNCGCEIPAPVCGAGSTRPKLFCEPCLIRKQPLDKREKVKAAPSVNLTRKKRDKTSLNLLDGVTGIPV